MKRRVIFRQTGAGALLEPQYRTISMISAPSFLFFVSHYLRIEVFSGNTSSIKPTILAPIPLKTFAYCLAVYVFVEL